MAAFLAAVTVFQLWALLRPGNQFLPGTDSRILYTWDLFTRSVMGRGALPYWNPYHFAGVPHLADTQTTVLYPPMVILRLLPPIRALTTGVAFHMWLAGIGTVVLCRTLGTGWLPAVCAALAFMLGGAVSPQLNTGHLLVIGGSSWLPLALALAVRSVRRGGWFPHPWLPVVLGLQFLAGFLQGSIYVVSAIAAYFLFSAMWPDPARPAATRRSSPLVQLAILGIFTAGLLAFQLLPTVHLVAEAGRTAGVPYDFAVRDEWSVEYLSTLVFPFSMLKEGEGLRALTERSAYAGVMLLMFVPLGFIGREYRRSAAFVLLLSVIAILFAFGKNAPLFVWHYRLFPGLRGPGRFLFITALGVPVMGALGLEAASRNRSRRHWRVLGGIAAGLALVWSLGEAGPGAAPWNTMIAPAAGVLAVAAALRFASPNMAFALALILVAVDLRGFAATAVNPIGGIPFKDLNRWIRDPPPGRALSICENAVGHLELMAIGEPTINGAGGVFLRGYSDFTYLTKTGGAPPEQQTTHQRIEGELPRRPDLLRFLNIGYVIACSAASSLPDTAYRLDREADLATYRALDALPRAFWVCEPEALSRHVAIRRLERGRYDSDLQLIARYDIDVRWAPAVDANKRQALEVRYGLADPEPGEVPRTWRYRLLKRAPDAVRALVRDPDTEDARGVDRQSGEPTLPEEEDTGVRDELLIGTSPCNVRASEQARVVTEDQPDGRIEVEVTAPARGMLFLSEPYYSERRAWVDGSEVQPKRVNLAFTGIPVDAGAHWVELRYVPTRFKFGCAISLVSLLALVILARHEPKR